MAGFANVTAYADSILDGRTTYSAWRKAPATTTVSGHWFDYCGVVGQPRPQYYASEPLAAATLTRAKGGFEHGPNVSPATKHLHRFSIMTATTTAVGTFWLMDYLGYYPFIDTSNPDPQDMDNTTPALSRYTSGDGVRIMVVYQSAGANSGFSFRITYTNENGVAGRVTQTTSLAAASPAVGTIVNALPAVALGIGRGPFVPLQVGDKGVRSIERFEMLNGVDIALVALVLVKPLASVTCNEAGTPTEVNYLTDHAQAPVIVDDAYLNMIGLHTGTVNGATYTGDIQTVWST